MIKLQGVWEQVEQLNGLVYIDLGMMEKPQTKASPPAASQSQPVHQSEILEDTSHPNANLHTIIVRINLPKDIINATVNLLNSRREKQRQLQARESSPEFQQIKEKIEIYRKLDSRSQDEQRRKNSELYRASLEMQYFNILKQKYNVALFESFEDRGKSPYIKFSHRKNKQTNTNCLEVRLNKNYIFQELKLSRSAILALPISFLSMWENDFSVMVKVIYKLSYESEKSLYYNLFIKSLDIISITFDVQYGDKRVYRFRYSPFEFRSTLFLMDNNNLTGYNQNISLVPELGSTKTLILDQEFYSAPRYFIFDDLTDRNMAVKIFQRTNIFYMAYSISRGLTFFYPGPSIDSDEYCKKCLWYIYFSTTRLKKFIFTWSFRPFRKNAYRQEEAVREIQLPSKESILHIAFYVEAKDGREMTKEEPLYKIRVQYHEPTREIPLFIKDQIIQRTREWYTHFRELTGNRDINKEKQFLEQERMTQYHRRGREGEKEPEKPDRQINELQILISSRDRFDRFLVGFLVIVSTLIDRNYFTMAEERISKSSDQNKVVSIETPEITYEKERHGHWVYFHWLEIQLEHKILPHLFHSKDEKERYHSHGGHGLKMHDLRIKCGEWRLSRICKWRRQWNKKHKKGTIEAKGQEVLSLPQIFRVYVDILVRHFPLRYIYKDVVSFILSMMRICYLGWEDSNDLHLNTKHESVFVPIITAILSLYYFAPLAAYKERDQKSREKMANQQSHSDRQERQTQERLSEEERAKRDDRLIDQFTKVVVLKILTKGDAGFMAEERLVGEVTFRLMDFKMCWITRVRQGVIMLRVFEDRIQFEKEYQRVQVLKFQQKGKAIAVDEISVREVLQKLSLDSRPPLIL